MGIISQTRVKHWKPVAQRSQWDKIKRALHYRLMIPLYRSLHERESAIRSVVVGVFVAMTPLLGIHMLLVLAIWFLQKLFFKQKSFNPLVAMAWTWLGNIFTLPPLYYLYIFTGYLLLGRGVFHLGISEFSQQLKAILQTHSGWLHEIIDATIAINHLWGEALLMGSIPWTILATILSHFWMKKIVARLG